MDDRTIAANCQCCGERARLVYWLCRWMCPACLCAVQGDAPPGLPAPDPLCPECGGTGAAYTPLPALAWDTPPEYEVLICPVCAGAGTLPSAPYCWTCGQDYDLHKYRNRYLCATCALARH